MSIMSWYNKRLLGARTFLTVWEMRHRKDYWIVTFDMLGSPHRYFCWDQHQVWRWSKTPKKATQFRSREVAISQVESCSMAWQYSYVVHRVTI